MSEPGRSVATRYGPLLYGSFIASVIVLGVFFRFHDLEGKLLWHDEVATRIFAAGYTIDEWKAELYTGEILDVAAVQRFQRVNPDNSLWDAVRGLARDDPQHPPVYYLLAGVWVKGFGDSIGTLRALSALLSLLGVFGIYWLSRELFASRRVAMVSVALFSVSPFFVLYAQEAREYSLWSVLVLLANAALLRAIRLTESPGERPARLFVAWLSYSLLTVLGLYTSFSTASVIIAQIAFIVGRERVRLTRTGLMSVAALSVSALLFLPWAIILYKHWEVFQISMRWSREIIIPRASLVRILALNASRPVLDFWPDLHEPAAYVVILAAVLLIVWSIIVVSRRVPPKTGLLLVALIIIPIALLLLPDLVVGGIRSVSARYITPSWIGVVLALAAFVGRPDILGKIGSRVMFGGLLAVSIASCISNARQEAVWTKGVSTSFPEVARIINASPTPLIVGGIERHSPGNLLALSAILAPQVRMQLLTIELERAYTLPEGIDDIFVMGPMEPLRLRLEAREHVELRLLVEDLFVQLWKVEWLDR